MKIRTYILAGIFLSSLLLFIMYLVGGDKAQKSESQQKIKVFILAGQSNMEGRADAEKLLPADLKRLSEAQENVQLAYNNEPLCPLKAVKPSAEISEIYERELIFGPESLLSNRIIPKFE